MAGQLCPASAPVPAAASQGLRPVDPSKKLPSVLGVKLTSDLRGRIAAAARAAGVSDSAWLRQRALDALGLVSAPDTASGRRPRVALEDQAALAGVVRELGEATLAARIGRTGEAVAAMERARQVLVPVVVGFERRA
ncbi:hypothetical protein BHAOGJBA_0610 [Methylobacterium hispanicum]|uniref:Ribbon-helix-helix protein CopG domain-containing protein n=1 Tax=Methylobacterium hispanicum TaxID=270350 RepID=A0AAV4ZF61_9HYPH|nr:hypothetical protein BHAOGJBA_0610 [Methylobacterium hispanicum]